MEVSWGIIKIPDNVLRAAVTIDNTTVAWHFNLGTLDFKEYEVPIKNFEMPPDKDEPWPIGSYTYIKARTLSELFEKVPNLQKHRELITQLDKQIREQAKQKYEEILERKRKSDEEYERRKQEERKLKEQIAKESCDEWEAVIKLFRVLHPEDKDLSDEQITDIVCLMDGFEAEEYREIRQIWRDLHAQ